LSILAWGRIVDFNICLEFIFGVESEHKREIDKILVLFSTPMLKEAIFLSPLISNLGGNILNPQGFLVL